MKSTDKLIVIIGVVIIVLAAIGIFLYRPVPKEEEKRTEAVKTYAVTWTEKTGYASPDNPDMVAYDKLLFKDIPYSANVTISQYNLKSVRFILTWEDDHTYGLLRKKGLDTLTFEVTAPDGTVKSEESVGNGTIEIVFDNINPVPYVDEIKANSSSEALDKLQDYYSEKWKDQPFKVNVSVKVGEKIFRPLKRLLDKGNNFTIEVEYVYYEPEIGTSSVTVSSSTSEMTAMKAMSLRERMYPIFAYAGFH